MYKDIFHLYRAFRSLAFSVFAISLLLIATPSMPAFAVDDAYLKALEVEAEKSAHVGDSTGDINGASKSKGGKKINQKEMMQFETELKSTRPATYRFYQKLDEQDQTAVFVIYKEDHKMTRASKTVFDLYFEKNK